MKKNLFTLAAVLCIMTTAMAQTGRYAQGGYSAPSMGSSTPSTSTHFQQLPPLKADFEVSLSEHHQSNLLQTSLHNPQERDGVDNQSIMLRNREKNEPTQYHFKRPKYEMTGNEDGFEGFRDYIVRKRRRDEGRPLQPLPLDFFRR